METKANYELVQDAGISRALCGRGELTIRNE